MNSEAANVEACMTRDDILRLALKAGIDVAFGAAVDRFAAVIAAAEREACAKTVERYCGAWDDQGYALAQAIRARGEG